MLTIRHWSPDSTPPPDIRPEYQVNTNGRGAVVYLTPEQFRPFRVLVTGSSPAFVPPRQKLMMEPDNRATWQREYRFT